MNNMKKNVRKIFWLHTALFAIVILYLLKFMVFDRHDMITNSYNPRLGLLDSSVLRGKILDRNGAVLAETLYDDNSISRVYPYDDAFAHVVGYTLRGRAGVESKYNFEMQKPNIEALQRIKGFFTGEKPQANSAALTLDTELQLLCAEKLNGKKGAIVAIEPSTGKVLAMASSPTFNPNKISYEWAILRDDEDNSPLINRATQGLYPPGSVFKIVTATAQLRYMENYMDFTYECTGEAAFGGSRLRCYNNTAHGLVDIKTALAKSCNLYFAEAGLAIGGGALNETATQLFFNTSFVFPFAYNKSTFELDASSGEREIVETAIGQGRTTVTPLHMAMLASSIANGGIMMEPYVLDHMVTHTGTVKDKVMPKMLAQPFTSDESRLLTELMTEAVNSGTGRAASVEGTAIAGKTGTAENATGKDHGWFAAFAPADHPMIAISILLEGSGGSGSTLPIAKEIFEFYLK